MPKGLREVYKIELFPDFDQKRKWKLLEDQCTVLRRVVHRDIEAQWQTIGGPLAKNLFLEGSSRYSSCTPDLDAKSLRSILSKIYDAIVHLTTHGGKKRGGRVAMELDVDAAEVKITSDWTGARVPYFGLIKCKKNKFLADSDCSVWVWENVSRTYVETNSNRLYLTVDCSESGEDKRRQDSEKREYKLERSKASRKKTVSKWLSNEPRSAKRDDS